MKFEEVLPALRCGKYIRKKSWDISIKIKKRNKKIIYNIDGTILKDFLPIYADHLLEDDWEIAE